jgi:multimeric flavodoxin WrbA
MKTLLISDLEYYSGELESLRSQLIRHLVLKQSQIQEIQIGKGDLATCMGCFGCCIKKPGECVIDDGITDINRTAMNCDAVIILTPVIFGQFSANIKNAIDRWLPNMLPFFITRKDGSTSHPTRYPDYPKQIMIGYGEGLSESDALIFKNINQKHRSNVDVLFWRGDSSNFNLELNNIELKRVGAQI